MTLEEENKAILSEIDHYLQSEDQRPLTKAQRIVLECLLRDPSTTYPKIAAESSYQNGSLRDAASKLFKKLSPITTPYHQAQNPGKFNKRIFIEGLRSWHQQRTSPYGAQLPGREEELHRLFSAIDFLGRRLICITGPIGIGKTRFVQVLCKQLLENSSDQEGFERYISCHAPDVPTVDDLYRYISTYFPREESDPQVKPALALTHLLRHRRLLLILEKGELLCDPNSLEGRFKPESESYEQWLRNLLDIPDLQSYLIWVGRIEPGCLKVRRDHLQSHRLRPLSPPAAHLLLTEQFKEHQFGVPPRQEIEALAAFCGYNPGVLQLAVQKICEEGSGISHFLEDPLLVSQAEDGNWQEALNALTLQEQAFLGWLLLYPDERIQTHARQSERNRKSIQNKLKVIQLLRHRGLLETDRENVCFLQSSWLCHVTAKHLVQRLSKLFEETSFQPERTQVLAQHPFIPSQAPVWKRNWHWRYGLNALAEGLPDRLWSQEERQKSINQMLQFVREASPQDPNLGESYAAGNLLNLAVALKIPLKNLDFTGLVIQQADLRFAQIQQANFKGCQLKNTALPVMLQAPIKAALSPDGSTIAIGDSKGWVLCWRSDGENWLLDLFTQIAEGIYPESISDRVPDRITGLAFAHERMLAIATDQGIYNWFLYAGEQPRQVAHLSSPVTSIAASPDSIAAGLENGGISVWSCLHDQVTLLTQYHTNAVQALAFHPERDRLASLGFEDRILNWDLFALESLPETVPLMFHPDAIAWQGEYLLTVGLFEGHYQMGSTTGQRETLPYAHADVAGMCFSQNGDFLAVIQHQAIEIWKTQQTSSQQTSSLSTPLPSISSSKASPHKQMQISDPPLVAVLSDDGAWLLTVSRDQTQVQLWSVESGNLHWEQSALEGEEAIQPDGTTKPMIFEGCQGLTPIEELYFRAWGADFGDRD